jgi:non-ribosomal peptide synthetase component F/acyl carrier protein
VCNFLASMRKTPGLNARDRLLAVTTLSFDIAVLELFLPLTVGAQVVIAQREQAMDGSELGRMITDHQITIMQATPTTWHMLLDAGWQPTRSLKALCGGEPLPVNLAKQLIVHGIELWNMYGPTETTVWSTLTRIHDANQKITIGKPIDNTQVWILDEHLNMCPVGTEGELCIGGEGVALGYFNRAELTAQRFINDPFSHQPGARLYRTGDLARWREDGTIEHLGRLDFQVKIRGYRIELGEIESLLDTKLGVARSVVIVREDTPNDLRLTGYVVAQAGTSLDPAALRNSLRGQLPDYMLPQQIVTLDALPLLPNGKIDRKALPAPVISASTELIPKEEGKTVLEQAIVQTMRNVLKLSSVGPEEDFFSLGGHSLLAARLVAQLNKELKLQLNLRAIFSTPTARKLAQFIEAQRNKAQPSQTIIAIEHQTNQDLAPLTLMQERIRFVEEMQPGRVVYNAPSAHRLKGSMNLQAFDQAFNAIIQRQSALRTSIVVASQNYAQKLQELVYSLLPLEDLSNLPKAQQETQLLTRLEELTAQPFVLNQGPLFKAKLFKISDQEHVLFFMPHHIIWDGWSFDVFYTEMSTLYAAYSQNTGPTLLPLTLTYADYAHWHKQWLKTDALKQQIAAWKKHYLEPGIPSIVMGDQPREFAHQGKGETAWLHLDNQKTEALRDIAKRTGSTLSIVCLSLYSALLSQWLDEPTPAIGIPMRGRSTAELEPIMGFFNNMLPIRLAVNHQISVLDWIGRVRSTFSDMFAFQDAPFELLARELPRGTPLYQAMFSFQDARARETHWGNLQHERIKLFQKGATDDLNLWMVEIPSGIEGGMQYNADLFLPSTIEALKHKLLAMIDALIATPIQTVETLLQSGVTASRRIDNPEQQASKKIPGIFSTLEKLVHSQPDTVAIQLAGQTVCYRELWQLLTETKPALSQLSKSANTLLVALDHPAAQLLGMLCGLHAGLHCLAVNEAQALSLMRKTNKPQQYALMSSWSVGSTQIDVQGWCDPAPVMTLLNQSVRDIQLAQTTKTPLVQQQLTLSPEFFQRTVSGLLAHTSVLSDEAILAFSDAPDNTLLVLAAAAWTNGACFRLAPFDKAAEEFSTARNNSQQPLGLVYGRAEQLQSFLQDSESKKLATTIMIDATEATPWMVQLLQKADVTLLNSFGIVEFGLPVIAGIVAKVEDFHTIGQPFLGISATYQSRQGKSQPPGSLGMLNLTMDGTTFSTSWMARQREDGTIQLVQPMTVKPKEVAIAQPTHAISAAQTVLPAAEDTHSTLQAIEQGNIKVAEHSTFTPTQRILARAWQETLTIRNVSLHDNFFDLGGTSLLAMQAAEAIEQQLGRKISPRRYVFETLEQLALAYDSELDTVANSSASTQTPVQNKTMTPDQPKFSQRIRRLVGFG